MKYLVFTFDGTIMSVAKHLKDEGADVIVGVIEDKQDILLPEEKMKPEKPGEQKQRLQNFDGIVKKVPARKLIKAMAKIKDKEDYFVITDSNCTYRFTQLAQKMGFNGLLPTQKDREMEVNREDAKEFVKANYPGLKIGEVHKFKTIDEGKNFLGETDKFWVLKSLGDEGDTIVSQADDPRVAKEEISIVLEEHKEKYEAHGFIFEEKIQDPIELTPQAVFYNGKLIYTSLDIENKSIGAGNEGIQIGCAQNLMIVTNPEDTINQIAFPQVVHEMAAQHKGIYIADVGILADKKGDLYFTEFCFNRFGWDAFPTEVTMSGGATNYFESIMNGKSPLQYTFGAGVRIMNVGSRGQMVDGGEMKWKDETKLYFYEMRIEDGKTVSNSWEWDFAVATGCANELKESVEDCYENIAGLIFEGKYTRPKFDFLSEEYSTSIINRYNKGIELGLFKGTPIQEEQVELDEDSKAEVQDEVVKGMEEEIAKIMVKGRNQLEKEKARHRQEMDKVHQNHAKELDKQKSDHGELIKSISDSHGKEMSRIKELMKQYINE